jgi:hypothetical protein
MAKGYNGRRLISKITKQMKKQMRRQIKNG